MNLQSFNRLDTVIATKIFESSPGLVPVGHWAKGTLTSSVEVGHSVTFYRTENSEGTKDGFFNTSAVQQIVPTPHGVALITRNSVWLLEKV